MTCVTIARGTTNANIRQYCLSRKSVPDLDDVLSKGRPRESMQQHNKQMISNTNTAGREIVMKNEPTFVVKNRYEKYSGRYELEKITKKRLKLLRNANFADLIGHIHVGQ